MDAFSWDIIRPVGNTIGGRRMRSKLVIPFVWDRAFFIGLATQLTSFGFDLQVRGVGPARWLDRKKRHWQS